MFHILIDTSVWLDLAADQRQSSLLDVLLGFLKERQAKLVLPLTVVEEFRKNRDRIAKSSAKSLASHFGQVRDAIKKVDGDERQKVKVLDFLADVDHRTAITAKEPFNSPRRADSHHGRCLSDLKIRHCAASKKRLVFDSFFRFSTLLTSFRLYWVGTP